MKKKEIEAHLRIVEQEIQKLQKKLERYPEGKISCLKNGKYVKWYHVTEEKRKYIPKSDIKFAKKLVEKQYIYAKLEDAIMEQKALSKYMKTVNGYEPKEELFFQNLFYGEIVSEKIHKTDMSAWANADYQKNPFHPEMLKYESISGNILRSKSELICNINQ